MLSVMRTTFDKLFSPKYLLFSNTLTFGGLLAFGDYIQQCRERNYIRQQHRSQRASLIASGQIHGQTAEGSRNTVTLRHDWGRTARMFSIGLVLGPFNHYWYGFLDRLLPAKTIAVVIRKILLDQTVASPFFAASYFIGMGALEGEKLERSVNVFTEKFLRVYMTDWCVWPAAQSINFLFIPSRFRVIYVNFVSLGWDTFLSYMKHNETKNKRPKIPQEISAY